MAKKDLNTVKNLLFWSYANLAMAHTAVDKKQEKYAPFNYMIRAKLFIGLMDGSMNVRTIFDNLIYACRSCNSSKGKKDLMEWMEYKDSFPPLLILRRYLKLVITYCIEKDLMGSQVKDLVNKSLPFKIEFIPVAYPKPHNLTLVV